MPLNRENEQYLVNKLKELVGSEVAELVESNMAPFRETLNHLKSLPLGDEATKPDVDKKAPKPLSPNARFEATVQALMVGRGDYARAADWYHKRYGDDTICKALAATDATAGAFLLDEETSSDVIELLRAQSVITRMDPQIEPMPMGVLRMPRQTGGATGTYIAENTNITSSEPTFGQVVAAAKKLAVTVPVSNDLIRRRAGTSTIVRDDVAASLATTSDLAMIRSDGTGGQPKGLRYWAQAANVLTVNATVNTENVLADLGQAIETLMNNNVFLRRVKWLMAPRTWRALLTMTSSTGQLILRDEMTQGMLMGYPFFISSQIPTNLAVTGTNESELYLVDMADIVLAETTGLMIDVSSEAAYHDGANVVAAFSQDQSVVRAIMEHDLVARHEESIVVYSDVDWTAITT
jgi:HK97 family phage major capsid protein